MNDLINLVHNVSVNVVEIAGSDELICKAARVSTLGSASIETEESSGLINFLMRNRHGSPFEHGMLMFRIEAPIFVWREFMRHRIGFSYNEQSGRYMQLEPNFYIPPWDRPLKQEGKAGAYNFVIGDLDEHNKRHNQVVESLRSAYTEAWLQYLWMLSHNVAKEVARMCLPVSIMSTAYVTCNPRSLMNFLSLRVKDDRNFFPTYPMEEINQVALQMEDYFAKAFPITHAAFLTNKRISP